MEDKRSTEERDKIKKAFGNVDVYGIISDTHKVPNQIIAIVADELISRNAGALLHAGDICKKHIDGELFGSLPVICAMTDEQEKQYGRKCSFKPDNWWYTFPGDRIVDIGPFLIYLGHKLSYDALSGSQAELWKKYEKIHKDNNNLRFFIAGHTHHDLLFRTKLIDFINPGAIEDPIGVAGGYEFAVYNRLTGEIIFSRIQFPQPIRERAIVGVIADTLDVTKMNPVFWRTLAEKFKEKNVTHVIHCGNIRTSDIGVADLADFTVHYYLRPGQEDNKSKPDNWLIIPDNKPIVTINDDYQFCVKPLMGPELYNKNEYEMHQVSKQILIDYPETLFLLCSTWNTFMVEDEGIMIIDPGNASRINNYVIIDMPRYKITFGRLQYGSLILP